MRIKAGDVCNCSGTWPPSLPHPPLSICVCRYVLLHVTCRPEVRAPKKGNHKLVGWALKIVSVEANGVLTNYKLKDANGKVETMPFEEVNQMKVLSN